MLPQMLAQAKDAGRIELLPDAANQPRGYLLALVTVVALIALPAVAFSILLGAWHYGLSFNFDPAFIAVAFLAVFSLAGVGVAMAVYSPHQQVTNALTQLIIFYVLFFAPVLLPKEQLPELLQFTELRAADLRRRRRAGDPDRPSRNTPGALALGDDRVCRWLTGAELGGDAKARVNPWFHGFGNTVTSCRSSSARCGRRCGSSSCSRGRWRRASSWAWGL